MGLEIVKKGDFSLLDILGVFKILFYSEHVAADTITKTQYKKINACTYSGTPTPREYDFLFFFAVYAGLRTQDDSLWGATETY